MDGGCQRLTHMSRLEESKMQLRYHGFLTRRGFCIRFVVAAGIGATHGWLRPAQVHAEARSVVDVIRDAAATSPIQLHKLRGNVTILKGSDGDIAILTGPDGKVFIDAGIAVSRQRILEAIRLAAVATETFATEKSLKLNGSTLHLRHYGPAHTDCDISIIFAEADTLHWGDTCWNSFYPFIDYSTGGSIDGMIRATEANITATGDNTIVIQGHNMPDHAGPSATRKNSYAIVRCSPVFAKTWRGSSDRDTHSKRLSPGRPPTSMIRGASLLSRPPSSPDWSTRARDAGGRRPNRSLQGCPPAPGQATQECRFEALSRLSGRDAHHLLVHDQPGSPRIHRDVKSQTSDRRSAKAAIPHVACRRLQHLKVRSALSETSSGVQ